MNWKLVAHTDKFFPESPGVLHDARYFGERYYIVREVLSRDQTKAVHLCVSRIELREETLLVEEDYCYEGEAHPMKAALAGETEAELNLVIISRLPFSPTADFVKEDTDQEDQNTLPSVDEEASESSVQDRPVNYAWHQTEDEIDVSLGLKADLRAKDLDWSVSPRKIR